MARSPASLAVYNTGTFSLVFAILTFTKMVIQYMKKGLMNEAIAYGTPEEKDTYISTIMDGME